MKSMSITRINSALNTLTLLAGLLLAGPAWAATLVQSATGGDSCGTSTATFGGATTNGNSILVAVTVDGTTIPTPTDGTNSYTQIVSVANGVSAAIYRATNITGAPSSVSVTSGSCTAIMAYEVAGLTTGNDGFNSGSGTSTTPSTGNVTTTGGGILISVVGKGASGTITPSGSGWTEGYEHEAFNTMTISSERQLSGGAATFADSWTLSGSTNWAAAIAAFKDSGGGGGATCTGGLMLRGVGGC